MEQILVVPREKLFNGQPIPHGFNSGNLEKVLENIRQFGYFTERPDAEKDPARKQIIPYMLIRHNDKLFMVRRLATQTEKRLHNKYSIGIGGHINPALIPVKDSSDKSGAPHENKCGVNPAEKIDERVIDGLERELHEELQVNTPYTHKLVGYINDDTNSVGQVHFGLVFEVVVADPAKVEVLEKDMMAGSFIDIKEVNKSYALLESWSQLAYRGVFPQP